MEIKYPEFKRPQYQFWCDNDIPTSTREVKEFFERGYDADLLKQAHETGKGVVIKEVEDLIYDYKIMLSNPKKYGLE